MDAMALLCTLHAGGPTTLQHLRRAGVEQLEEIAALCEDELARIVGASPAAARRFAREAAFLARRLSEAAVRVPVSATAPVPMPLTRPARAATPEAARMDLVELRPAPRPPRPDSGLRPGPELRPGLLDGLTAELCADLARVGVRTAGELALAADLALARRLGCSYPRLLDLAHQARACGGGGAGAPARSATLQRVDAGCSPQEESGAGGPFT